jgi:uncharacterized protein (TIGR02646 family)
MRKINKSAKPDFLSENDTSLTAEYIRRVDSGDAKFAPWRNSDIVSSLTGETYGKCAYCEAIISDVAPAHVEHIKPKSKRPDLVVDWQNLTLACPNCNSAKGDYYSEENPLIDPVGDCPDQYLLFAGPAVAGRLGEARGILTVIKLKLMRAPLVLERAKRIEEISAVLHNWAQAETSEEKEVYAEYIVDKIADDAEFSAMLRKYVSDVGFSTEIEVGQDDELPGCEEAFGQ